MVESFDGYSKIDQQCNLGYEISNMTTNEICYTLDCRLKEGSVIHGTVCMISSLCSIYACMYVWPLPSDSTYNYTIMSTSVEPHKTIYK